MGPLVPATAGIHCPLWTLPAQTVGGGWQGSHFLVVFLLWVSHLCELGSLWTPVSRVGIHRGLSSPSILLSGHPTHPSLSPSQSPQSSLLQSLISLLCLGHPLYLPKCSRASQSLSTARCTLKSLFNPSVLLFFPCHWILLANKGVSIQGSQCLGNPSLLAPPNGY